MLMKRVPPFREFIAWSRQSTTGRARPSVGREAWRGTPRTGTIAATSVPRFPTPTSAATSGAIGSRREGLPCRTCDVHSTEHEDNRALRAMTERSQDQDEDDTRANSTGDIDVGDDDIDIEHDVDGDLASEGGNITVAGDVYGDVSTEDGNVDVDGTIHGSVTTEDGAVSVTALSPGPSSPRPATST